MPIDYSYSSQHGRIGMSQVLATAHNVSDDLAKGTREINEKVSEISASPFVKHMQGLLDSIID